MVRFASLLAALAVAGCAAKFNNKPADMPGSPAEAERMHQDNTPDKAPPGKNETPPEEDSEEDSEEDPE